MTLSKRAYIKYIWDQSEKLGGEFKIINFVL
jgi:hypothetical protein